MDAKDQEKISKREQQTLNEIQEELNRIAKLGASLSPDDEKFIRARKIYLNADQREMWAAVLKKKSATPAPAEEEAERKAEEERKAKEEGGKTSDEGKGKESELSKLPYKDLQTRAKELGVKAVGVPRKDLEKSVAEAEAKANNE